MAQPQHVRNDVHYASPPHCGIATYLGKLIKEDPSLYEFYTNQLQVRRNLFGPDSQLPPYKPVDEPGDTSSLTMPRAFWHTEDKNPKAGKGIAEFTNVNFVSAGTNFRGAFQDGGLIALPNERYPLPLPTAANPSFELANTLLGADTPPECVSSNNACVVAFFTSTVTDNYRPAETRVNLRASTASIFDQDLQADGKFVSYPNLDKCTDPSNLGTCERIETNVDGVRRVDEM